MEMHQLRYVVAVARTRNFSRAAEQCHVAQPSLSQQIQKLEDELGERLFERMKREVKLTAYGENFLRRAVRILDEAEAARREAIDSKNIVSGVITIGVLPTIAPYLLPGVLVRFREKFSRVEVVAQEDTTAQLLRQLLSYEIDFAIVSQPIPAEHFEARELFSEELLLALPPNHRLLRCRNIGTEDLEQEQFIVMKEGHCLGDQVLGFCNRQDLQPKISFRSAQLETIQALVYAGLGLSLIPAMATQSSRSDLPQYRSMRAPRPVRKVIALWPNQRPLGRAADEFLKVVSGWSLKARATSRG